MMDDKNSNIIMAIARVNTTTIPLRAAVTPTLDGWFPSRRLHGGSAYSRRVPQISIIARKALNEKKNNLRTVD